MDVHNVNNISINELRLRHELPQSQPTQKEDKESGFKSLIDLKLKDNELQLSKHAQVRLNERGVAFSETIKKDIEVAVDKARQKGAKDVAVIGMDATYIVNVKNNTIITMMNKAQMKDHVFTNIDSAVFI